MFRIMPVEYFYLIFKYSLLPKDRKQYHFLWRIFVTVLILYKLQYTKSMRHETFYLTAYIWQIPLLSGKKDFVQLTFSLSFHLSDATLRTYQPYNVDLLENNIFCLHSTPLKLIQFSSNVSHFNNWQPKTHLESLILYNFTS